MMMNAARQTRQSGIKDGPAMMKIVDAIPSCRLSSGGLPDDDRSITESALNVQINVMRFAVVLAVVVVVVIVIVVLGVGDSLD